MGGLGSKDLARYRETGKPLGKTAAIKAKCAECMANYANGRDDCTVYDCPLYPFMPYAGENLAKTKPDSGGDNIANPSHDVPRNPR
jgi:hypothetical protein